MQASHIAAITAAKTTIEATPAKRDDFELAADFLILNAPTNKSIGREHRISQVTFEGDHVHDLKSIKIDDRFYTPQEYRELSDKQKHKLKLLREEKSQESKKSGKGGGKGGGKRRGGATSDKKKFKKMKANNKKLQQRISTLEIKLTPSSDKDDNDESDSSDSDTAVQFNQRTGKSKKSKKK